MTSTNDTHEKVGGVGVSDAGRNVPWPANLHRMALPELIRHAMDSGLSARRIAQRGGISHPTVIKWSKATATDTIDDGTIEGLAVGLGLDRDVVYRAALGTPAPAPFDLPARAARLNDRERRAVLGVVEALLARADPDAEQPGEVSVDRRVTRRGVHPNASGIPASLGQAARRGPRQPPPSQEPGDAP